MTDMIEATTTETLDMANKTTRSLNDKRVRLKENRVIRNPERSVTAAKFLGLSKVVKNATLISCITNDKGEVETTFTSTDTLANLKALYKSVVSNKPTQDRVHFSVSKKQVTVKIIDPTPQIEINTVNNRLFLLCSTGSRFNRSRIWKTGWQSQSLPIQDSLVYAQKDLDVCEVITIQWGGLGLSCGAWYRVTVASTVGASYSEGEIIPKITNADLEKRINSEIENLLKKIKSVGAAQLGF